MSLADSIINDIAIQARSLMEVEKEIFGLSGIQHVILNVYEIFVPIFIVALNSADRCS